MAWPNSQARRVELEIQAAQVPGALTDFPVLITRANLPDEMCSPTDGNRAQSDGGDIRAASNSDGSSPLALEVVRFEYDTSDGAGDADVEIWVKVTSVSASVATAFWLAYNTAGTTSVDTSSAADVWTDYEAVLHLATSSWLDSTGNSHDATATGAIATTTTSHPWGGTWAQFDNNVNEYLTLGSSDDIVDNASAGATVQALARKDSDHQGGVISNRLSTDTTDWFQLGARISSPDGWLLAMDEAGATEFVNIAASGAVTGWLAITWDATDFRPYLNGSLQGSAQAVPGDGQWVTSNSVRIGHYFDLSDTAFDFHGKIGEVRIRLGVLSADWLAAEYNNQSAPGSFVVEGTPEDVGGASPDLTTGVEFDGSTDDYFRAADLDGNADAKTGAFAALLKTGKTGVQYVYAPNAANRFYVAIDSSNKFALVGKTAAATTVLDIGSSLSLAEDTFYAVLISWDLANATAHLYINDADCLDATTLDDGAIDYTVANHYIGSVVGAARWQGCIGELWFTNEYIDFSVEANRRDFFDADGNPVDKGSDGSTPTGTAALIYLSGGASQFGDNFGTGGAFTENGTPVDCAIPTFLSVLPLAHSHAVDEASAASGGVVQPSGVLHAHSLDEALAVFAGTVSPLDVAHSHALDLTSATVAAVASPEDLGSSHLLDAISVAFAGTISPADVLHAMALEASAASSGGSVSPADMAHGHALEDAVVAAGDSLTALALVHGHTIDAPTVTFAGTVSPVGLLQAQALDTPGAAGAGTVSPTDVSHAHSVALAVVTFKPTAVPVDVSHGHLLDAVVATFGGAISPTQIIHGHILDAAGAINPAIIVLPDKGRLVLVAPSVRVVRLH